LRINRKGVNSVKKSYLRKDKAKETLLKLRMGLIGNNPNIKPVVQSVVKKR